MVITVNTAKNRLFVLLQSGLPLVARPFAELGRRVGLTEEQVLQFVQDSFAEGMARRMNAVFDARRLGYRSVLCAINEPDAERLSGLGAKIAAHAGVTHCYERSWPLELDPRGPGGPGGAESPNLWFVLVALQDEFDAVAQEVRALAAPYDVLFLPARKRFKIDVVFDPEQLAQGEHFPDTEEACPKLSETQQELVRVLQAALPVATDCFAQVAQRVGMPETMLLAQLREWQAEGLLRRLSVAFRRTNRGFKANAMCVWNVAAERITAGGRALAAFPEVEHCYERVARPEFCYNLYALIRASNWPEAQRRLARLESVARLVDGRLLGSAQKFKRTGMSYFNRAEEVVTT